ncbi:DNA damage-repair/toleration protein DRT100-like isoform X2 [Coffea eugenioides]|uniref:Uncharacterized protein isoform X2 n=1 Tax=Coffea arabica TaxID=13443 RepID=A0ABM4UR11_COFAR|nr:DNA damage-repair/toleration protein DRT100-like isoform X2 [Coffea arabica]XP_027180299.1 DNA damage-repair/toleration protein DRT100-like isoform X2 [Coffea eugenioides]
MIKLLVVMLSILCIFSLAYSCPPSDRAALLAIKAALNEPYLGIFKSWTGTDCCMNWYGVSCDPEVHRVTEINLRGVSEDSIFKMAHRTGYMSGTISRAICRLNRLSSLAIADWKGISGTIPSCITSLPCLSILDLVGNKLTGGLPTDIGQLSGLTMLIVADNQLTGRLPRSLTNLSSLTHLDLRNNFIRGTIPRHFGKLRMLSRALLSRNRLHGKIPKSISHIHRLSDLDLSLNRLSGRIPPSLGKMAVLATLNLGGNNISVLDLSYNQLKGTIPKSLVSASFIGYLDLSHNHLCGLIPEGSPFDHLEASSFVYNDCLCGKPLRDC